ncbi:HD domain-containing protein [Marinobacterium maritimum]|uniref:HD domain-containing protein n=1 Tax=Marinobacterium maritimum TaxID=500162 RepID=A0ABN1I8K5_9GAMM
MTANQRAVLASIEQLYADMGQNTYGEGITQTEHGVQCAELARRAGENPALITAALLHDIGHLLEQVSAEHGNFRHDQVGAEYLLPLFGPEVAEPVRLHAQAKRYLCTVEEGYLACLSEASVFSLKHQGGMMTDAEVASFRQEPHFEAALKLRRWDDEGKDPELASLPFSRYGEFMQAALIHDC